MKNGKQQQPVDSDLRWRWYVLDEMKPRLLYDMLALREAIFVIEQNCIYQELDGLDKAAQHLLVTEGKVVIACLRVLPPAGQQACVRIGRVAVSSSWRKHGIARSMMLRAIEKVQQDYPSCKVYLAAQTYLKEFYQSLGFQVCGDEFLEDGIQHVPMQI